jgi:hypothetical protein
LPAGERDGYASTMPVKKLIESKPSIKVEMNVANSPTSEKKAVRQVRGRNVDVRPNWKEQPTRPTVLRYE